jgi:hypothetical protein
MRKRDPRRLLARHREAKARVSVVKQPETTSNPDGSVTSRNLADITVPTTEIERIWNTESLERLARTYWRFLTRVSLGLLRVLYTESSREVVLLMRPFVLLRFKAPEYDFAADRGTVTWPIDRGLLVARERRGHGYLRLSVARRPDDGAGAQATATVTSEVVNFYPTIAARFGRFFYDQTQLRIHVIVTNAFLRSLANLELEPSIVGALSPDALPRSPAASPGRAER